MATFIVNPNSKSPDETRAPTKAQMMIAKVRQILKADYELETGVSASGNAYVLGSDVFTTEQCQILAEALPGEYEVSRSAQGLVFIKASVSDEDRVSEHRTGAATGMQKLLAKLQAK
jgi:hypothetical protein